MQEHKQQTGVAVSRGGMRRGRVGMGGGEWGWWVLWQATPQEPRPGAEQTRQRAQRSPAQHARHRRRSVAHLVGEERAKQPRVGEEVDARRHQPRGDEHQQAAGDDEEPLQALDGAAAARHGTAGKQGRREGNRQGWRRQSGSRATAPAAAAAAAHPALLSPSPSILVLPCTAPVLPPAALPSCPPLTCRRWPCPAPVPG